MIATREISKAKVNNHGISSLSFRPPTNNKSSTHGPQKVIFNVIFQEKTLNSCGMFQN
jgi:hypothetical protein